MARSHAQPIDLDPTIGGPGAAHARGPVGGDTGMPAVWPLGSWSRNRVGRLLVAFGLSGLAILLATTLLLASVATGPLFDEGSPTALADALAQAKVSVSQGAVAATAASQTLATTRDSATATAQLLGELAATMRDGATSLRVTIFGQQPFTPMADSFSRTADKADAAAAQIAQTGTGVEQTRASLDALSTSLTALAADLDVARAPLPDRSTLLVLVAVLALLLGWLAVLAAGCLAAGVRLLRPTA
jgi:hypothetical protein